MNRTYQLVHWLRTQRQRQDPQEYATALVHHPAQNGWGGRLLACSIAVALATVLFLSLSGCATSGAAYVPVIDTKDVDMVRLNADLGECQAFAKERLDAADAAVGGAIIGALLMAAIGGKSYRGDFARAGAVAGGTGAAISAEERQRSIIRLCMSLRGYKVLN